MEYMGNKFAVIFVFLGVFMFEKEAERCADEYRMSADYSSAEQYDIGYANGLEIGFEKGADFGYNKANEWHKPSEKLPEECTLVLAYLFEDTKPTMCKYVVSDQWECLPRRILFCSNDQVRLWKEIVPPKE